MTSDFRTRRILLFAKAITPEAGGIETYSDQIARAYARAGFTVTVVSCFRGERAATQRESVQVINVGIGSQFNVAFRMLKAAMRYRLRYSNPVFVHATTWRVALPALIAFPKSPLVVSVHGREVTEMPPMTGALMRFVFRATTKCLVISRTTLAAVAEYAPAVRGRSIVSWNGIVAPAGKKVFEVQNKRIENTTCRILTICRLVPRKNVASVIRALALLIDDGCTEWEYVVVGEGPEYENLKAIREKFDLASKVHLRGRVSSGEIVELYSRSDIFVHPQVSGETGRDIEGFGLVIADAMAWGLPVIVGRDGAPKEFVSNGINGYVVDGAVVQEIAEALKRLIQNRDLRAEIGQSARIWATENLSWDKHVAGVVKDPAVIGVDPGRR